MPEPIEPTPWVEGRTIGEVLRATAARFRDQDAVVFPDVPGSGRTDGGLRWSWAELDRRVDAVAKNLLLLGIEPGEHVGIWSMNCPEWIVTQFAVGRIGAGLVNINPAYRLHELEESLNQADVATLIVGAPFKTSNFVEMVETLAPEVRRRDARPGTWRSERLPRLRRVVAIGDRPSPGWLTWDDLEAEAVDEADAEARSEVLARRERTVGPNDVYNVQFTSGTTGLPKGAMLTHRNVLMNAFCIGERVRYTERDRVCVPVPFYHCFGCVLGTAVCAVYGSAIVVPAASFDPAATLAAIEAERCTSLYGVPTMFIAQLDHPDRPRRDLRSLRTGIMAGSPCPLPVMKAVIETLGIPQITIGYGLTEASPIITMTSVDDPIEVRVGTVGRPIPGVEVRLVVPATGKIADDGEPGELCVRGHGVMAGYYNNPEATARVLEPDGWLHAGDLAQRRSDGNYRIVGRIKELIIRGGENIYPPEIEEFLMHHPDIAEVAVVGLPDSVYGEVVSAWVVPKSAVDLSADELRTYCQGRIAHFKIPRYIEIVDALPRTVTGKVRKHILREQGIERFGLENVAQVPTA
jgi:fatty-acyl-CoA synthase